MERDLKKLTQQVFDLAIVGGGINGAATAREAALRGLKVAILEARDFASGTSSRSSKLIHGGLRYLEQFDFKLVHESRRERRILQETAPHLAHPLPFLLPIYRGDPYFPLKIRVGLSIYDLLGNLGKQDRHHMLSAEETLRRVPALKPQELRAGAVYYDSETDDARLTIENILDATEHGAVVANYAEIQALALTAKPGGKSEVVSAEAVDRLTGRRYEVAARYWVNATGPWVDHVRALLPGFDGSRTIRLTKGTHLIVPAVAGAYALFAAIRPGERVFLMLPWHDCALLGTTDTDYAGDPAHVQPEESDVGYLLAAVNRVLRAPLKPSDVLGSFAGLRALVYEPGRSPSATTREYRFHTEPGVANFLSICGGKLTTARALGEKLVNQVIKDLGLSPRPGVSSRTAALPGGWTGPFEAFAQEAAKQATRDFHLSPPLAERIVRTYGSRWRAVLEPIRHDARLAEILPGPAAKASGRQAGPPAVLAAEVDFAIRQEMAMDVEDFFLRRSGLNWLACYALREAAPAVARIFAAHFAWSAEREQRALEAFGKCGCVSR